MTKSTWFTEFIRESNKLNPSSENSFYEHVSNTYRSLYQIVERASAERSVILNSEEAKTVFSRTTEKHSAFNLKDKYRNQPYLEMAELEKAVNMGGETLQLEELYRKRSVTLTEDDSTWEHAFCDIINKTWLPEDIYTIAEYGLVLMGYYSRILDNNDQTENKLHLEEVLPIYLGVDELTTKYFATIGHVFQSCDNHINSKAQALTTTDTLKITVESRHDKMINFIIKEGKNRIFKEFDGGKVTSLAKEIAFRVKLHNSALPEDKAAEELYPKDFQQISALIQRKFGFQTGKKLPNPIIFKIV